MGCGVVANCALLRRDIAHDQQHRLAGGFEFNTATRELRYNNESVSLTEAEFDLLASVDGPISLLYPTARHRLRRHRPSHRHACVHTAQETRPVRPPHTSRAHPARRAISALKPHETVVVLAPLPNSYRQCYWFPNHVRVNFLFR